MGSTPQTLLLIVEAGPRCLRMMHLVLLLSVVPYLVVGFEGHDCDHCPFPYLSSSSECARAYEDRDCKKASFSISNNHNNPSMSGFWDDNIDTVVVRPGCTFRGYADANYHGDSHSYQEWDGCHDLGDWFENDISSYKCECP